MKYLFSDSSKMLKVKNIHFKAHITKQTYAFGVCWNIWNLFDKQCGSRPDCSTLFASILMLTNKQTFSGVVILLAF